MANPIIKIKRGNENRLYSNEFNITENNGDKTDCNLYNSYYDKQNSYSRSFRKKIRKL